MKFKLLASVLLAASVLGACNKTAPNVTPTTPDPVLKAATEAGAIVNAVQSAELAFYASGNSHISAADQATVQTVFANVSAVVLTTLNTYSASKTAANQQALVSAIVTGVNAIVAQFARMSDAQARSYAAWVQTAVSLIDLVVPGAARAGAQP